MSLILKKVKSTDLYLLRNKVLRNSKGIQYCKFEGDEREDTVHFAVFKDNSIIENTIRVLRSNARIDSFTLCIDGDITKNSVGNVLSVVDNQSTKNLNFLIFELKK